MKWLVSSELNALLKGKEKTNLGSLLASASLALGVGQSGGLLSGLRRLSLRKEDQRAVHIVLHLL
jgi:hypothetical protein